MQDYEAIAAKLANALRDMLAFPDDGTRMRARKVLNDFDNGRLDEGVFRYKDADYPDVGSCGQCREMVQPYPYDPDGCPFCAEPVHRP